MKFQFDIFIFEGLATDQTLLQLLKQNSNWSAHSGRNFVAGLEQNASFETMLIPLETTSKRFRPLTLMVMKLQAFKGYYSHVFHVS